MQLSPATTRPPFRYRRGPAVAVAYAALLATLAVARPTFFRGQFRDGWVASAPTLTAAVGMTLVLLARHVDISVGSQFSACGGVPAAWPRSGRPCSSCTSTRSGSWP